MTALTILLINAIIFTGLSIWYYWKTKGLNIGTFILVFYAICTWGAVLYHEHELFNYMRGREIYRIEPFIYLIPTLLLFMYPILRFNTSKLEKAQMVEPHFLFLFIKITLCVQIILYIVLFPAVLRAIMAANIGDLRHELYDEAEAVKFPHYSINLLCRLYMGARNICIIISYALLFVPMKRTLIKVFFITSFIFPLYIFTAYVSRAVMMQQIALSVFIFLALFSFIAYKQRRRIMLYIISFSVPVIVVFNIISQSRFGNLASYMFYRYLGESFNNYNTQFFYDLHGSTWGVAYLGLFRKLLGEERLFNTVRERWAYLDNITGVDTHVFYTFIGGLNIEFGFEITVLIGFISSFLICKCLRPYNVLTLPKFILIGMLGYTIINGAFCFILQGDWGNLEIIFTIFLYILFKNNQLDKFIMKKS